MSTPPHVQSRPRGMAACKERAKNDFFAGRKITDCPYKSISWRNKWLSEFQNCAQLDLFSGLKT